MRYAISPLRALSRLGYTGVLAGALLAIAAPAVASSPDINDNGLTCFNGYAYTLKAGDYRYTEHHEVRREHGQITDWNVTYVGRDGQPLATKHMDFSANPYVPVYRMVMPGTGYMEGIRHDHGQWTMVERDSAQAKTQEKSFDIKPPMAADSGFNQLVQAHFADLMHGQTVAFRFVAAGRQSVLNLKAYRSAKTTFENRPAVTFTAKLDMFLLNHFLPSLKLTYDPKTERLLEYRGIGNLHDGSGKVYPVRVSYYDEMPTVAKQHGAPAAQCGSAASL